jgi:hypothetical protein
VKSIVVWGDCQANATASILRDLPWLTEQYEIVYLSSDITDTNACHPYKDPALIPELIGRCEIMLRQDVWNWEHYPHNTLPTLRGRLEVFPSLSFMPMWPFNGPDPLFSNVNGIAYGDWALAQLRKRIPDPEKRLLAYKTLDIPNPFDMERFCELKCEQALADDARLGYAINQWIIQHFRTQQTFHTVTHPLGRTLGILVDQILTKLDLFEAPCNATKDYHLWGNQVPLHPVTIEKLGITWANEDTAYMLGGKLYTWEGWARLYIESFG